MTLAVEISIEQEKIAFRSKYKILMEGIPIYVAISKLFRFPLELHFMMKGANEPEWTIKKEWAIFDISCELKHRDGHVFHFRTKNYWERHFYCQFGSDLYEIFGHRGRKFSVYRNGDQIACWTRSLFTHFGGDRYKVIADYDCNPKLLSMFCLIMDHSFGNNNHGQAVSLNLGYIGAVAKDFNEVWQPKPAPLENP
jgi:hypothetical protein